MPTKGADMSTTTQERLEAAVKNLQSYADEIDSLDAPASGEQLGELKNRMEEVKNLKAAVKTEAEARGEVEEAKSFLASLGGSIDDAPKPKQRESLTMAGMPMETQGKTFGELFVSSPAYKEFLGRFGGRDGIIPNSAKGIQSGPFQTPDMKALLTGASETSAGAAVRNDRYGSIIDLVGDRELTVYDLVTKGSTGSDTVEYVRVTAKTNNAAPTAEATTSAAPTVTVDGNAQSGVALVNNAGGGYKPETGRATNAPR